MLTLENKMLEYINAHPEGVRTSDLEAYFGEPETKIGFILCLLHKKDLIIKNNSVYLPVSLMQ